MRKLIRFTVIAVALLALMGCVQTDVVVKVNPDGSGTLEKTVMMSKAVVGELKSMAQGEGEPPEMWEEDEIRAQAERMGEGVEFQSMDLVETEDSEGYKAVFSFTDINNLLVNQNPGGSVPAQNEEEGQKQEEEFITFHMEKGSPATLTIRPPEKADKEEEADRPEPTEAEKAQQEIMQAMMKMMLEGMKISVSVEVAGDIVSTNATYRDGSRITLMEADFDKLLQSEEDWDRFAKNNPATLEESKALMKDVPGMKVETEKEIEIKFE